MDTTNSSEQPEAVGDTPPVHSSPHNHQAKHSLSQLASYVASNFARVESQNHERKLTVNPVVSKVASWYEKLRNAMEYHEEEVILRASIERILKRRLMLGGNAKTTSEPLVRELIWAGYLKDNEVPVSIVDRVERSIDLHLKLRFAILQRRKVPEGKINEWTYHLLSSDIAQILNPNVERQTMANFMFQVIRDDVSIPDDTPETRDAQVYIAVRRSYAKDDLAFLRYYLFQQYFGELREETIERIADHFYAGYTEILRQLTYPRREKIYTYVKKRTAAFLILEDVLREYKGDIGQLVENEEEFEKVVLTACETRYKGVAQNVRRAIVRSVIFILFTKVIFAFLVEGTYERVVYGEILWNSILLNTGIPPILMIVVSLFIRTPGVENSKKIFSYIKTLLFEENPRLGGALTVYRQNSRKKPFIQSVFAGLWLLAFLTSFGAVVYILTLLHFNIVSQGIFLFFLAIVSFLSYRISLMAHTYSVGRKQTLVTPFIDFFFMPIVRVGRRLTQSISQVNFLLFIFDFFIDTPFKVLFAFFEQWFHFLHSKRDDLE
jgi:hypothetical protein